MNILAVDTAGKTAAVAVLRDDVLLYEAQCNNGLTHSETLLPMIDTALKAAGLTVDDLDVLGVTNGPGSFTGLRIGLAVIKGLALPRQLPCPARSPARASPRWLRWPTAWRARAPSSVRRMPAAGRSTGAHLIWRPMTA